MMMSKKNGSISGLMQSNLCNRGMICVGFFVLVFSQAAQSQSTQPQSARPQTTSSTTKTVEQTFLYIKSTLDTFRGTGRLVNNPGIDGADLEVFIDFLAEFEATFSVEFSPVSAMCNYYLDPENSRMTIEERAEIAFSFLSELDKRISRYSKAAEEFDEMIEVEFGQLVLEQIKELKLHASSHQRLPSSQFDEEAVISFLDSACV
jgi:hypothetical protein